MLGVKVTLELFTVEPSMASLKVRTIGVPTDTPVAPFVGLTLATEGFVVSAVLDAPVVKLAVNGTNVFPA